MRSYFTFFTSFFFAVLQVGNVGAQQIPQMVVQETGTGESFRGLSVLSDSVAWAGGTGGTFLRTTTGGKSWQTGRVPGADSLDFRSIHAFSASRAILVSAGQPALVYLTENGGQSWEKVYEDTTGKAFFDAVSFWDAQNGLLMSDPVDSSFLVLKTSDGGRSWQQTDEKNIPPAKKGEAGFAASGSGLVTVAPDLALFGTGGPVVRVYRSTHKGTAWQVHTTPLTAETASTGIYSIAMKNKKHGVAVGGDYTKPEAKTNHLLITRDGGKSWSRKDFSGLGGYRSGVAFVPGTTETYIAVGPNGMDISFNGGKLWKPLSQEGMHAIRFAPSGKTGWASGAKGKIIKLSFTN